MLEFMQRLQEIGPTEATEHELSFEGNICIEGINIVPLIEKVKIKEVTCHLKILHVL